MFVLQLSQSKLEVWTNLGDFIEVIAEYATFVTFVVVVVTCVIVDTNAINTCDCHIH